MMLDSIGQSAGIERQPAEVSRPKPTPTAPFVKRRAGT